ncbi:Vegetative incompatibility protein HET-E-1 [Lachnellula suecica]|uniref:Vegetative incompatibility protein HET-E-1 n=1 Tax=Lachnellula suecica TaxID=602035 RepID=A0A8T9CCM0_9HELO|nr:Vegetative incompatibility protein HET-E-1 [Lachnellula suecica]
MTRISRIPQEPLRTRWFSRKSKKSKSLSEPDTCPEAPPASSTDEDLWARAYENFSKEHEDLVKRYERVLRLEEAGGNDTGYKASDVITHSSDRLTKLAKSKLDALDDSKWRITIRDKEFIVQDGVDKVITGISAARNFVGNLASSEPHAAIAWAGVCVCLPLLLNSSKQYKDAQAGLLEIPCIMLRYQFLEPVYRNAPVESAEIKEEFEKNLTDLYCKILQYQIRAICQWSRNKASQYFRDVVKADQWSDILKDIQKLDAACQTIFRALDSDTINQIAVQSSLLRRTLESWRGEHEVAWQELRSTMSKSAAAAEARKDKEEERRCHQAFGSSLYVEHKNRNPARVQGTCNWFLESDKFKGWKSQEDSCLLWVSADPGCDEQLLFNEHKTPAVCYFFFKDGLVDQQGVAKCISALLHQLFAARPHLLKYAMQPYRVQGSNVSNGFSTTWGILVNAAADPHAGEIICVLDALDECEEEDRYVLIDTLKDFYTRFTGNSSMSLKFLVTSRPYTDIQRRFTALTNEFPTVRLKGELESEAISKEINLVIRKLVPDVARDLKLSMEAEDQLRNRLLEVPNRTYLWLHLTLEEVRRSVGATTPKRVNKLIGSFITNVPKTVEDAYDKILNRERDKYFEDRRRLLHLVLAALRPLTLAEASVALPLCKAHKPPRTTQELDPESEEDFRTTVQTLCGLFVSIVDRRLFLIHQTAREYLLSSADSNVIGLGWKHTFDLSESEQLLARCCIIYLHFREFEGPERHFSDYQLLISQYPFLSYAANWTQHYDESNSDVGLFNMALKLCDRRSPHHGTWRLFTEAEMHEADKLGSMRRWTPLMVVVRFGFNLMAIKLLEEGENPAENILYDEGKALDIASAYGHVQIVKTLLQAQSKPSTTNEDIWRALYRACEGGHEDTAALLLSQRADIQARVLYSVTPLDIAVYKNHINVVDLLLKHSGANVNCDGGHLGTPLQAAAFGEFGDDVSMVRFLLAKGAKVNLIAQDSNGSIQSAPLALAASRGRLKIMSFLLEHGADLNRIGDFDSVSEASPGDSAYSICLNPLSHAARENQLDAMKLLLDLGADIRQKFPQSNGQRVEQMNVFDILCSRGTTDSSKSMRFLLELKTDPNSDIPELALFAAARFGLSDLNLVLEICPSFEPEILAEACKVVEKRIERPEWPSHVPTLISMKFILEEKLKEEIDT